MTRCHCGYTNHAVQWCNLQYAVEYKYVSSVHCTVHVKCSAVYRVSRWASYVVPCGGWRTVRRETGRRWSWLWLGVTTPLILRETERRPVMVHARQWFHYYLGVSLDNYKDRSIQYQYQIKQFVYVFQWKDEVHVCLYQGCLYSE